tara:strand:+ start:602 stop:1507 length:906 start_codon:yes stop_codon:yes gene_type:complete
MYKIPLLNYIFKERKDEKDLFSFFKEKTNHKYPLFLGKVDFVIDKSRYIKKSDLLLNVRESKENKLIVSSLLGNRYVLIENILFQHMINNRAIIFLDTLNDISFREKIITLSQKAKRKDDVVLININENNLVEKIKNLYLENKIIVLYFEKAIEKCDFNYIKDIQEILLNTINMVKSIDKKTSNLKDLFLINEGGKLFRRSLDEEISKEKKELISSLNINNISFLIGIYDYTNYNKDFTSAFPTHIIQKQYDPELSNVEGDNIVYSQDIKSLDNNKFFIFKASKGSIYFEKIIKYKTEKYF